LHPPLCIALLEQRLDIGVALARNAPDQLPSAGQYRSIAAATERHSQDRAAFASLP